MGALADDEIYLFEGFRLDRRGLSRRDERGVFVPVPIGSRALDVLRALVETGGDILSKDEIMAAVWPGTIVGDNNLTVQISTLRHVLDQAREEGSCIQTVAGRGYRFIAPVTRRAVGIDRHSRVLSPARVERSVALTKPSAIPARRKLRAWVGSPAALGLLALVCVTVVITAAIVHWSRPGAPSSDSGPAVVVMPFRNLGDGAAQAKLGEAIAERIAVELARLPATRLSGKTPPLLTPVDQSTPASLAANCALATPSMAASPQPMGASVSRPHWSIPLPMPSDGRTISTSLMARRRSWRTRLSS
jgi:DNA-binding winged helix-turn-helix (wHTH) protein